MKKVTAFILIVAVVGTASFGLTKHILDNNQFDLKSLNNASNETINNQVIITEETLHLDKDTLRIEGEGALQMEDKEKASTLELIPVAQEEEDAVAEPVEAPPETVYVWEEEEEVEAAEEKQEERDEQNEEGVEIRKYIINLDANHTPEVKDGKMKIGEDWFDVEKTNQSNTYVLSVDKNKINTIHSQSEIVNVEKDNLRKAMLVPNDEYYNDSNLWNLIDMSMSDVWDFAKGNQDIVVAVIDSGVADHDDLTDNILKPYNVVSGSTQFPNFATEPLQKENDHGTLISGLIAAKIDNGIGITGVAPDVSIMPINIFSWVTEVEGAPEDGYYCYDSDLIDAIHYAVDNGAHIINLSLGGYDKSNLMEQAIRYATSHGVMVVAAAGNDNSNNPNYPAAYDGVFAVGSVDKTGVKSSFSNYGDYVDVSAPGTDVLGLTLNGYSVKSGTSISAATVTALAALLKSEDASLTTDQIETIIKQTAIPIESDSRLGSGKIQPLVAVQSIQNFTVVESDFHATPATQQEIGKEITLKNTVKSYGKGSLRYRFIMKKHGDTEWTTLTSWSETTEVVIKPETIGEYDFKVERTLASNLSEENSVLDPLKIEENIISTYIISEIPKQTEAHLTISKASPQSTGTEIEMTVSNNSEPEIAERAEYKFEVKRLDQTEWLVLKDWSNNQKVTWKLTEVGEYAIRSQVRTVGRESSDIIASVESYFVELPKQTGVAQAVTSEYPFEIGETVTLKASAQDSNVAQQAEFKWLINDKVVQDWTLQPQLEWKLETVGSFNVEVQARTQGRTGVDVNSVKTYEVVRSPLDAAVKLTVNKETGDLLGDPIIMSAQVVTESEKNRDYEYQFSVKANDEWTVLQPWSNTAEYNWYPSVVGQYDLMAKLRIKDDETEKVSDTIYGYNVIEKSTVKSLTVTRADGEAAIEMGQLAKFDIAVGVDEEQTAKVKILVQKDKGDWITISDWNTVHPFEWKPGAVGVYAVKVLAQVDGESEYTFVEQILSDIQVVDVPKQTGVTLEITGTQLVGIEQTLVAASTSEAELANRAVYKFVSTNSKGETVVLQDWSSETSCKWTTNHADNYAVRVYIKTDGGLDYSQFAEVVDYAIELPKQTGVTIATNATSLEKGQSVEITALVTGENEELKAQAVYRFLIDGVVIQEWSQVATCTYQTNRIGELVCEVQARTQGRSEYDVNATTGLTVNDIPVQTGVKLTINKPSQQPVGTVVQLKGEASGDATLIQRAQYRFLIDGVIVRGWSTAPTYDWTTSNEAIHTIEVQTRTQGRTTVDANDSVENYETGIIPLEKMTVRVDKNSPQLPDQRISFEALVEGVHRNDAEYSFEVREKQSSTWQVLSSYVKNNNMAWTPSAPGEYTIRIRARAAGRANYDVEVLIYDYVISGLIINYLDYSYALSDMVSIQMRSGGPVTDRPDDGLSWVIATQDEVKYFVNPDQWKSDIQMYQFLTLKAVEGITEADANNMLRNKGVLHDKGAAFLQAQQAYNVNVAYLVSHALLETGNGTSQLATGVYVDTVDGKQVEGKTVYNMYGIGAYDSDPIRLGAEYAYKQGWDSVDKAIIDGAYWIGRYYIHRDTYNGDPAQDSIYKMRWNPEAVQIQYNQGKSTEAVLTKHQYATDIAWASKQVERIKELLDLCEHPILEFNIPKY